MNHAKWISSFIFSGCLLVVLMGSKPAAAADCEQWVAKAVSVQGNVQVQRVGVPTWKNIKLEDRFCPGDIIRILEKSRAALVLRNESVIRLDENTTITVKAEEKSRALLLRLIKGAVHFFSQVPRSLKVATPFVNCAVEATEFFVRVEESRTYFSVFRGRVRTFNDSGELLLAGGQTAIAAKEQAPSMITIARPRDAVNWSLYYPSIGTPEGPGTQKDLYSASQLLQTGQVTKAQDILTRMLNEDPGNSDALALNAIIALTLHRKEDARALAEKAVASSPRSSPAKLALGYVQQAFFNVEAARSTMQSAAADNPENALVWARLSELWLATGYLNNALSTAEKAAVLSPDISRTQTVLGFAYVSQIKINKAKEAFQKAIVLDQADPLPRLGLGLALIREGDLKTGRAQIEIAAGLDPGNALVRSYLGKAFYEEKKNDLAERQYAVAKELDPNDPTPYYYDAIRKQTENRPVEAFHDLQESIEKNDNRAVYRSKLLLDEDLAARSASLGRIYRDLGFEQRALVEGWKSTNTDPSNYSSHRLLADTYASLPRHEIARVSELLQSQLLQPLNITPVQPQLAESSLFILEGSGPANPAFNEYNSLFLRNRLALQASGVVAENKTLGDELVQSGVWGSLSYSLGQFHYETDGFRENNDQNIDIYNVFAQGSVTPNTSLQGEYRFNHTRKGDMELTFLDTFNPDQDQNDEVNTYRLGLRHSFNPHDVLLASAIYQRADLNTVVVPGFFELGADVDHYIGEMNYQSKLDRFKFILGGGYRHQDFDETIDFGDGFIMEEKGTTDFTNIYLYSMTDISENVSVTAGVSGEFLNGATEAEDSDSFNPKLGLMWNPVHQTTIRAAAFKTLQRPLISKENIDPTIEPTQVAGFNQFFLGVEGNETRHYGIGIDHAFCKDISAGAEFIYRDIDERFIYYDDTIPDVREFDLDERWVRSYLYWTPFNWLALRAEYLFEMFERETADDISNIEEFVKLRTHRFPLGARIFCPMGFSIGAKATYVDQTGDFLNPDGGAIIAGDDQFTVVDASISYRLPKRYGIITLEAKNLFDQDFNFQDTDPANPRIYPERLILLKGTLSF